MNDAATRSQSDVLRAVIDDIDDHLNRVLRGRGLPSNLEDAIAYAALGGGKRLRPALLLMCCEAVGGDRASALPAAAAIELIHCFSLIHDDLPAMDDDDMRRGRPTLHVHAGEAMAILAGDAMSSLAFELIAATPIEPARIVLLTGEMADATTGMIIGQVFDTVGGLPTELGDEQRLALVHRHKTGALLRAACRMGAICGDADEQQLDALTRYGEALGLMFQIVDDLLDVTQTSEHLGKTAGKDESAGKLTYPAVFGVDRSRQEVQRLREEAQAALEPLGHAAAALAQLCEDMAVRTR